MQSVYTNPRLLLITEQNKTNICELLLGKSLDALTIAEAVGLSHSRITVICKQLSKDGYVTYDDINVLKDASNKRKRRFYTGIKLYVPKEIQLKVPSKHTRENLYYGQGKLFNPWEPKIPEGSLREVSLFNEKDNNYFKMPLKKRGAISIGSTFSLYDGATL